MNTSSTANSSKNRKLRLFYKFKYGVAFTNHEFDILTLEEFVILGEERRLRISIKQQEEKAAVVIQTAARQYLSRKRYAEYISKYKESQRR